VNGVTVLAQCREPARDVLNTRSVPATPCEPRERAFLGGLPPDLELAALAAAQLCRLEESHRFAHLVRGADHPGRGRVAAAVGGVIADGPNAEPLCEELEDRAVVAAQLHDGPRLEPAQAEVSLA
jgi:hypothetical protein